MEDSARTQHLGANYGYGQKPIISETNNFRNRNFTVRNILFSVTQSRNNSGAWANTGRLCYGEATNIEDKKRKIELLHEIVVLRANMAVLRVEVETQGNVNI